MGVGNPLFLSNETDAVPPNVELHNLAESN